MTHLVRSVWLSFLRGKGLILTGLILFALWWVVSFALGMEGSLSVNGRAAAPIGEETRARLAVGFALRCLNCFGMLFVVLQGVRLLLGDADRGGAAVELTAPIGRGRYLLGRSAGVLLLLTILWALSLALLAGAMKWRLGAVHGNLLAGGALILVGQVLLGTLVLFLRLLLTRGWGELIGLLLWGTSWLISLDLLEMYLFDVGGSPGGTASWWFPLLEPYLAGEPAGPAAAALRRLFRLFPPVANVQSVGIDLATGGDLFPTSDWYSIPAAGIWFVILAGGAYLQFRKRDLQ